MGESDEQKLKKEQVLAEEARLLYVGITRARDYLILPSRQYNATKWLNRICNNGDEKIPTLDPNTHETKWEWNGHYLDKKTKNQIYPRQFPESETILPDVSFLEAAAGESQKPTYEMLPEDWVSGQKIECKTGKTHTYFHLQLDIDEEEKKNWAKVQAHFLRAALYLDDEEKMQKVAAALYERFDGPENIDSKKLVDQALAWKEWLAITFKEANYQQVYPIKTIDNGRSLSLNIDLVAQTETDIGLIQNQLLAGDSPKKRILENGASLWASAQIIQQKNGSKNTSYWVHLVDNGQVVEVLF